MNFSANHSSAFSSLSANDPKPIPAADPRPRFRTAETSMALVMFLLVFGLSRHAAMLTTAAPYVQTAQNGSPSGSSSAPGQASESDSPSGQASSRSGDKPVVVIDSGHPALCNRPKNRI